MKRHSPRDIADVQTLYETLHSLSESVGRRLRKKNLKGSTIKLKLRWRISPLSPGRRRLPDPTNDDREIYTCREGIIQ